jgi:hypothetical protein
MACAMKLIALCSRGWAGGYRWQVATLAEQVNDQGAYRHPAFCRHWG